MKKFLMCCFSLIIVCMTAALALLGLDTAKPVYADTMNSQQSQTQSDVETQSEDSALIKTVIKAKTYVEFVYNGTSHAIAYEILSHDGKPTGQEVKMYQVKQGQKLYYTNSFTQPGEYHVYLTAFETSVYAKPKDVAVTVRILPKYVNSMTEISIFPEVRIYNTHGFAVRTKFDASNISRKQYRKNKKAVKSELKFTEKVVEQFNLNLKNDSKSIHSTTLQLKLPENFSRSQNYRFFSIDKDGNVKEIDGYVINQGYLTLSDVSTSGYVVVSRNKEQPYGWIWLSLAILSAMGIGVCVFLIVPRRMTFYLDGEKIYNVKVARNSKFALTDGLENHEWYVDKQLTIKVNAFAVGERSKKFYATSIISEK